MQPATLSDRLDVEGPVILDPVPCAVHTTTQDESKKLRPRNPHLTVSKWNLPLAPRTLSHHLSCPYIRLP